MKIITATAALQAKIVTLGTVFPIATSSTIDGYTLQNANGEACGGTFLNAFAVSCNSVFAPLGARLGGSRLVRMAERFGFNQPLAIPGAAVSEIPSASTIGSALAVGSSAIGQGMVLASALEMTDVGATIAMGGRRPIPFLTLDQKPHFVHVTSRRVARLVQRMMIAVVQYGTGTAAAIAGVTVAGKTGTAELRNTTPAVFEPECATPELAEEHGCMVRRLRAGRQAEDRRRRTVPRERRRRRDRRPRCTAGAGGGAGSLSAGTSPRPHSARASPASTPRARRVRVRTRASDLRRSSFARRSECRRSCALGVAARQPAPGRH